jgi:DtxR family Mn-dependent transcriptional regulator
MQQTRKADSQPLSPVLENYLEAIFRLEARDGAARASSIASMVRVSRSTVTGALNTLKGMGYVEYSPYSLIHLTEKGKIVGRKIAHRHFVFQAFLEKILFLDPEEADSIACSLEHVVPEHVILRLGEFVLFLKSRPALWANWPEVYKEEGILQGSHTRETIAEVLGRSRKRPRGTG